MKRALTIALTVALLGSLAFAGFAGTAAAATTDDDGQSNYAAVQQGQSVTQDADASSDNSFALAVNLFGDESTASTGSTVDQEAENEQEVEIEQENENTEDTIFIEFGSNA